MIDPYESEPVDNWEKITLSLINKHPLKDTLTDICLKSWQSILNGKINSYLNLKIKDMSLSPQAVGALLHDIVPEYITKNVEGFRKGCSNLEKDIVCIYDDSLSIELKTSSQKAIYGNRSYAKSSSGNKEKYGFYLTINFDKINGNDAKIKQIRFGWLSHNDWRAQKSETGQQASLKRESLKYKLITLYKP